MSSENLQSNNQNEPQIPWDDVEYRRAVVEYEALQKDWIRKRAEMRVRAEYDLEAQAAIHQLCTLNPLFWFDWFAWTYDPRAKHGSQWVPFILYQFQRDLIMWLLQNIEETQGSLARRNLLIEKSRDMGISWLVVSFFYWFWAFRNGSFLIGSRKEEEVDKKGDLDTPFEKLRRQYRFQPNWLLPQGFIEHKHDKYLLLINPNGGEISGEAATADFGRGGRKLVLDYDELQSWEKGIDQAAWTSGAQSTNVRLAICTANGTNNLAYRLRSQKEGRVDVKRIHWTMHPIKAAGLSRDKNGGWTSPWYREQCATMGEEDIAAELDIKYERSVRGVVFKNYVQDMHGQAHVEIPFSGTCVRALDPGLHFYTLWVIFDHFGRVLCVRELYETQAHIRDIGNKILIISSDLRNAQPQSNLKIGRDDVGDPNGSRRQNSSQDEPEYATLSEEFDINVDSDCIGSIPPHLRVKSRITAISNLLGDFCAATKTMRLLVDTTQCPILHEALSSGYKYKTDKYGKNVLGEQIDERHPFEDAVDCLGYAILYKLGVGARGKQRVFEIDEDSYEWKGQLSTRRIA